MMCMCCERVQCITCPGDESEYIREHPLKANTRKGGGGGTRDVSVTSQLTMSPCISHSRPSPVCIYFQDELVWAASWLYRATNDSAYLDYLVDNDDYLGGSSYKINQLNWDDKIGGAQILMSRVSDTLHLIKWMQFIICPADGWVYLGIDAIEHLFQLNTKGKT